MANQSFVSIAVYSSSITEDQIRDIMKNGIKVEDKTIEHPFTYTEFEDIQFNSNKYLGNASVDVIFAHGTCRWGLDDDYLSILTYHLATLDGDVVVTSTQNEEQDIDILFQIESLGSSQFYRFDIAKEWQKQGANPDEDDAWEKYDEEMEKAKDAIDENTSKILDNYLNSIHPNLIHQKY